MRKKPIKIHIMKVKMLKKNSVLNYKKLKKLGLKQALILFLRLFY